MAVVIGVVMLLCWFLGIPDHARPASINVAMIIVLSTFHLGLARCSMPPYASVSLASDRHGRGGGAAVARAGSKRVRPGATRFAA